VNDSIKAILSRVFSEKYVNHAAVADNVFLLLMYRFAYPFAYLLNKIRLSPNNITTQSLVFTVLSFFALIFDDGWIFFTLFWGMAVLLDFCDGTVARMANKVSKTAFRYDHMSDIFKIYLVVLGVGVRNDDPIFWVLCSTLVFSYTYSEVLSHDLKSAEMKNQTTVNSSAVTVEGPLRRTRIRERFTFIGIVAKEFPFILKLLQAMYGALVSFNGHTLLFFFTFPIGGWVTRTTLIYLISLTAISSVSSINKLRQFSR